MRGLYPAAHIAGVARPLVAPVLSGLPFVDEVHIAKAGEAATFIRDGRFELGVVLPNSFRSAWVLFRGGVTRRLGYAHDWRSPLLTDRISAVKRSSEQQKLDAAKSEAIARISREELAGAVQVARRLRISAGADH